MPTLLVNILEGRTDEQKRAMVAAVTQALVDTIDCKREDVKIIINDMKLSDYAIGGKTIAERRGLI